jgi:hypothetical protein
MAPEELLIRDACLAAAADLEVRIVTPFSLAGDNGSLVEFIALFPDFGSPNGVAVCHFQDWPTKNALAVQCGYYCSGLHPDSYARYSREQFVDAFAEWGWRGAVSQQPAWSKG